MDTDPENIRYQVIVPREWKDDLLESIRDAAKEAGVETSYSIQEGDSKKAESELKFDPITTALLIKAGLYVGNIVVEGVAAYFIHKGIDRFVSKIQESKQNKAPAGSGGESSKVPMVVRPPSGNAENFDASNPAAAREAITRMDADAADGG